MNNKKYNYTQEDYEFMNSLSSAVLERSPRKLRVILWFWIITVALLITWAYYAQIDEIVRGEGKVVPVGENKMIQNLEGGIVESILVKDGDIVKKGQILLKIENQKSQSDYESMNLKSLELMAKVIRLSSEANDKPFLVSKFKDNDVSTYIPLEQNLYEINKLKLNSEIDGLQEQLKQKENDYLTAKSNINYLSREYNLIQEEVRIAAPLVAKKVRSKVDFLKLKREANNIRKELALVRMSIPKTQSLIEEAKNKIQEVRDNFRQVAQEELNKTVAELERINANITTLKDKVKRTNVYSPINGIIQKLFINTIGGVIKPGENLVEIVPTDDTLLIETKIKPADIAFLYYKQKAKVKFTAYDYAIYGGLEANVIKIGADTEIDEDKNSFYTVYIQTNENHLKKGNKELPIIPGMVVNVDILTGKKTVLDYILKPILKAKQYTFTER
ncbi:HlyD family type I secretion periplasmic adaptor subunit [Poseidonibacter sp.]|uniref:HlyD family type I secretion periplasmic adaptor subunit n=1 Tax=Poseidonibacter sp. TaxID=2321188 RepID=UPI003C7334CC